MATHDDNSLGAEATYAGKAAARPQRSDVSLGDERTLGDGLSGEDTIIDDIEIVDLEARYKIEGHLGQGGMGAVLLATDTRLDRKVAIKRILGEAAGNRMAIQRFLTEAKSIAALNHPNIVQIYDYGRAKDGPFLIMEYVDGGSLLDRCRESALPLEEAIDLACQLCDGLAKAHDLGIIHRDIKPANVLLTKDGTPKLTDFGLAKAQAGDHGQTVTGAVLGTPDFMPPEQKRDASLVDARSDLWSLAATVYQMVTGRSPKIIRFDRLPAPITTVLGKALEEEKGDRYQSAREFRDALKTGVRVTAGVFSGELVEGRCPACSVQNDPSRKFCKGCGGSLIAPCLNCDDAIPIWDEICGSCGARQSLLVDSRRGEMAAKQAEAEGRLGDCDFAGAAAIAAELREESHPKLRHLKEWAGAFADQIEKSQAEQMRQAVDAMKAAYRHEAAHDYLSAVHSLESIPEAMRGVELPGKCEPAEQMLSRIKRTLGEAERLEKLIRDRITSKSLDDLLPDVEKLLLLRPDRADVKKLCRQLVDRQQKQAAARDEAIASATASLAANDHENALRVLRTIAATAVTPEVLTLLEQAEKLRRYARGLLERIKEAVAASQLDGLVPLLEQYLAVKPGDAEIVNLRRTLEEREEKIGAEIAARLEQARELEQATRFEDARKVLSLIPEARRSWEVDAFLDRTKRLACLQQAAYAALAAAKPGTYGQAIARAQQYDDECAAVELRDTALKELLATTRVAYADEERARELARVKEERARELASQTRIAGGVALAVIILVAAGLWVRSNVRAWSLASAIEQGRWDDALAIDPDNTAALVGRARARLSVSPPDLSGAASDVDRAARGAVLPGLSTVVMVAKADVEAARACEYALQGRLDDASRAFADAQVAFASPAWLDKAGALIQQSWLKRAEEAVANGDAKRLVYAISAARSAGAAAQLLAPLQAGGLIIEASRALGRGEHEKAMTISWDALETDFYATAKLLKLEEYEALAERLLTDFREKFWKAVQASAWKEAVGLATEAAAIANVAKNWLPEALTADRVEQLVRDGRLGDIPPIVFTELAQSTLASLSPKAIAALPPLKNSIGMELRLLPAGFFIMGHPRFKGRDLHPVTLTRPFLMGLHEVTPTQWKRVMMTLPAGQQGDEKPMTSVSWADAQNFCARLSALPAEKAAGREYRLPTEAEWEYACRAGSASDYGFGDDAGQLGDFAWFKDNSGDEAHPPGHKKPNAWGLFDMHGNVQEWCSDWYADYVPDRAVADPTGPAVGSERVIRGGSYTFPAASCTSHYRSGDEAMKKYSNVGFRCVLSRKWKGEQPAATIVAARNTTTRRPFDADMNRANSDQPSRPSGRGRGDKESQIAASSVWKPGDKVVNSIGISLAVIAPGEFMMGTDPEEAMRQSPEDAELRAAIANDRFEERQHRVRITRPFLLGIHEVTQRQYRVVTGENPSHFVGDDLPVEHLTWEQARDFCKKLTDLPEERAAGRRYRLPTEAEWEYACRAGTTTRFHVGGNLTSKDAKFHASYGFVPQPTAIVGSYPPNAWGLHDMHGNVWEWTADWYDDKYFYSGFTGGGKDAGIEDPTGPRTGTHHVLRGGSSSVQAEECHSAIRGEAAESDGPGPGRMRFQLIGDFGLRVACDVAERP